MLVTYFILHFMTLKRKSFEFSFFAKKKTRLTAKFMTFYFLFSSSISFFRFLSSNSGKIYLQKDIRMIIFRKSDLDTASDYTSSKGFELRSFVQGPNNPKFSPRRWKKQEFPSGNWKAVGFLEDFRSEFQSEKQMTVEFLETFEKNSSGKSIWLWNF